MIPIVCPGCGKAGQVPVSFSGKRVRCRRCGHQFAVAAEEDPPKIPPGAGYFTGYRQFHVKNDE